MSSMTKRSLWTSITPLPSSMTRSAAIDFLQDHEQMIDMNPLVSKRHPIPAPAHAEPDEQFCTWYSVTDKITYLPGLKRDVEYTCAFHNLPDGIQTHCHAPMGVDIRDKWTIGGTMPGEPPQPVELGLNAPATGLYIREDVDLRCNIVMAAYVKKTMKGSHSTLVETLRNKVEEKDKDDAVWGQQATPEQQQIQFQRDGPVFKDEDAAGRHGIGAQPSGNHLQHPVGATELE